MTMKSWADCPHRYTTLRNAKRKAWDLADRAGTRPLPPEPCDRCRGWHLADTARPDTTATEGAS